MIRSWRLVFGRSWLFALSVCALMTYASAATADATKLVREFSSSKTGYVTTSNDEFDALVNGNSRSYAVCMFADSTQYRNSGKLELVKRLENVATASKAILKHQKSTEGGVTGNFIVTRVVLEDSRATFGRMGVVGLPFFGCIPSSFPVTPGKNIELPNRFVYPPGPVEDMKAQDIADFIGASTGIDIGEPQMQPRSPFLPFVVLFFLGNLAIIGYKLANSWLIHYMPLYICGSLLVYWFSVSGGMFNIIRGMPFVGVDRRSGGPLLFMPGNGQVGAEGFIMGTSTVAFGMLIAHFLFLVPTIESPEMRRKTCYALLVAGFVLFNWITSTHIWKIGLRSSFYF